LEKKNKFIDDTTYKKIYGDGILSRAYGLPKIHKLNNPLRIIISSINSQLYSLTDFIKNINISIPKSVSYIKNSYHFVNQLNDYILDSGHSLASLDVILLFTNMPFDHVIKSIEKRWNLISNNTFP